MRDIVNFDIGKFMFGIFPYWIGFSIRNPKPYRVIDLGFFKIMWVDGKR